MFIFNLREKSNLLYQYVQLRNVNARALLTNEISLEQTREYLKKYTTQIYGAVEKDTLEGVVILYTQRNGEIAIFVRNRHEKVGTNLLEHIEAVAEKLALPYVWAWVSITNRAAQGLFKKQGFMGLRTQNKVYNGTQFEGIKFRKYL